MSMEPGDADKENIQPDTGLVALRDVNTRQRKRIDILYSQERVSASTSARMEETRVAAVPGAARHSEPMYMVKDGTVWLVGWLEMTYIGRFLRIRAAGPGEEVANQAWDGGMTMAVFQCTDALKAVQTTVTLHLPLQMHKAREFLELAGSPHWSGMHDGVVDVRNSLVRRWAPGHPSHGDVVVHPIQLAMGGVDGHGSEHAHAEQVGHGHAHGGIGAGHDQLQDDVPFLDAGILDLIQAALDLRTFHQSMVVNKAWYRNVVASTASFRAHRRRLAPTEHLILEICSWTGQLRQVPRASPVVSAYQLWPARREPAAQVVMAPWENLARCPGDEHSPLEPPPPPAPAPHDQTAAGDLDKARTRDADDMIDDDDTIIIISSSSDDDDDDDDIIVIDDDDDDDDDDDMSDDDDEEIDWDDIAPDGFKAYYGWDNVGRWDADSLSGDDLEGGGLMDDAHETSNGDLLDSEDDNDGEARMRTAAGFEFGGHKVGEYIIEGSPEDVDVDIDSGPALDDATGSRPWFHLDNRDPSTYTAAGSVRTKPYGLKAVQAGGLVCYQTASCECPSEWECIKYYSDQLWVWDPVLNNSVEVPVYSNTDMLPREDENWYPGAGSRFQVIALEVEPSSRRCNFKIIALARRRRMAGLGQAAPDLEHAQDTGVGKHRWRPRSRKELEKAEYATVVYDSVTGMWKELSMRTTLVCRGLERYGRAVILDGCMYVLERSRKCHLDQDLDKWCPFYNKMCMCQGCRDDIDSGTFKHRLLRLNMSNTEAGWTNLWPTGSVARRSTMALFHINDDLVVDHHGRLLLMGLPMLSMEVIRSPARKLARCRSPIVWQILPVTFELQEFGCLDTALLLQKEVLPRDEDPEERFRFDLRPSAWFYADGRLYITVLNEDVKQLLAMEFNDVHRGPGSAAGALPEFFWLPPSPLMLAAGREERKMLSVPTLVIEGEPYYTAMPICPRTDAFLPRLLA